MKHFSICILFVLTLTSCSKSDTYNDYFDKENGLWVTKSIGDYVITAQYRPSKIILKSEFSEDSLQSLTATERMFSIKQATFFNLEFKTKDESTPMLKQDVLNNQEYIERLLYFQNQARFDFELIIDSKHYMCNSYIFEDSHSLSGKDIVSLNFLVTEDQIRQSEEVKLLYSDKVLGTGELYFVFDKESINAFN